jgi:shikimate kinase
MNIVLTGFMGSGKSTVGKILAHRLKMEFFDTDTILEEDNELTINEMFERYGEKTFREMERAAVRLVSTFDNAVISTGGGVPLDAQNIKELKKNGIIIYLSAGAQEILNRVKHNDCRPLIKKMLNPLGEIKQMLESRKAAYQNCDFMVNTEGISAEAVAEIILSNEQFSKRFTGNLQ